MKTPLTTLTEGGFQRYERSKSKIFKESGGQLQTEGDPAKRGLKMTADLLWLPTVGLGTSRPQIFWNWWPQPSNILLGLHLRYFGHFIASSPRSSHQTALINERDQRFEMRPLSYFLSVRAAAVL